MRRITYLLIFLLVPLVGFPQAIPNVEGDWYGTSSFVKMRAKVKYELTQKGSLVEGFAYVSSYNQKDSSKMRMSGLIEDNKIMLRGHEFVYKVGRGCLANVILEFSKEGDQEILKGKWKGDLRAGTCAPGLTGQVLVYREAIEQPVAGGTVRNSEEQAVTSTGVVEIPETDDIGNVLVTELSKRKYYGLIIGIEDYQSEDIQDLENPISDAERLAEVLTSQYSFEAEDLTLLKNPDRDQIIESLDQLAAKVTETDNLLIFYAGHGIWNEQLNQGYWLPNDASMNSKSKWLSNSTIRDYVGGIRSKHTLLISDACFSGGILKERAVFENSRAILELYKLPSRKAMTSGTLKTVPDKSVFLEYLIKNLTINTSPLLSADQLFRNFKIAVINNSPNGQVPQYGPITQAGDEGGDFIFLREE